MWSVVRTFANERNSRLRFDFRMLVFVEEIYRIYRLTIHWNIAFPPVTIQTISMRWMLVYSFTTYIHLLYPTDDKVCSHPTGTTFQMYVFCMWNIKALHISSVFWLLFVNPTWNFQLHNSFYLLRYVHTYSCVWVCVCVWEFESGGCICILHTPKISATIDLPLFINKSNQNGTERRRNENFKHKAYSSFHFWHLLLPCIPCVSIIQKNVKMHAFSLFRKMQCRKLEFQLASTYRHQTVNLTSSNLWLSHIEKY